jgi:hypothetical protein
MEFTTKAQAIRTTGITYLGSVSETTKHKKSKKYGELTYSLYLAPAKTSGHEVCAGRTKECTRLCLNESGMNTMNLKGEMINNSRIAKTRLFFDEPDFFMSWMIFEISQAKVRAEKIGFKFSVRLNNTSDISPEDFNINGKNILEIFSDVQFYDYTKVKERVELTTKYPNYDLTYSYTGYNLTECEKMLLNKIRVAVVFKKVPESFMGYKVIDGDKYDMRYKDNEAVIIGLKFKRVRNQLTNNIKFVVQ